jgi:hypothetical protein
MIQDKILYTDGHDVTVTDTMFHVRNMSYRLVGITKHGLHIMPPHRLPAFLLMFVGVLILVSGVLNLVPPQYIPSMEAWGATLSGKTILLSAGAFLILVSVLVMGLLHERYALRISTAEGEKDVIVSKQKEYVTQIINALNRAFNFARVKK